MIPRPTWDSIVLDAKANSFLERTISENGLFPTVPPWYFLSINFLFYLKPVI